MNDATKLEPDYVWKEPKLDCCTNPSPDLNEDRSWFCKNCNATLIQSLED